MEPASFATLLRRHRLAHGWTQDQLAARARMSTRGVSDLERGLKRAPRATTVRLLIDALELSEPEAATLLAAADTPRRGAERTRRTLNLPRALTSFMGRERELGEVRRLLGTCALVTLVGPGGVGKTRLAVETARLLMGDYPDGVHVVELSSLRDAQLAAGAVADAIGLSEQPGRPLVELLRHALRSRHLLLILDNCEHLIDTCAPLIHELLRDSMHLRILATSREPLQIPSEQCFHVAPLDLPSETTGIEPVGPGPASEQGALGPPQHVLASPAVRLFVERAQAVLPNFALDAANAPAVSAICEKLDGLPLALEVRSRSHLTRWAANNSLLLA